MTESDLPMLSLCVLLLAVFPQEDRTLYIDNPAHRGFYGAGAGGKYGGNWPKHAHAEGVRRIEGVILDADGKPIAGLWVQGWCCSDQKAEFPGEQVPTDADGRFTYMGVWEDDLRLVIRDSDPIAPISEIRRYLLEKDLVRSPVRIQLPLYQSAYEILDHGGSELDASYGLKLISPRFNHDGGRYLKQRSRFDPAGLDDDDWWFGWRNRVRGLRKGDYFAFVFLPEERWWFADRFEVPDELGEHELDLPDVRQRDWRVTDLRNPDADRAWEGAMRMRQGVFKRIQHSREPVPAGEYEIYLEDPYWRVTEFVTVDQARRVRLPAEPRGSLRVPLPDAVRAWLERQLPTNLRLRVVDENGIRIEDHRCRDLGLDGWLLEKLPPGKLKLTVWDDAVDALYFDSEAAEELPDRRTTLYPDCDWTVYPGWLQTVEIRTAQEQRLHWEQQVPCEAKERIPEALRTTVPVEQFWPWEYERAYAEPGTGQVLENSELIDWDWAFRWQTRRWDFRTQAQLDDAPDERVFEATAGSRMWSAMHIATSLSSKRLLDTADWERFPELTEVHVAHRDFIVFREQRTLRIRGRATFKGATHEFELRRFEDQGFDFVFLVCGPEDIIQSDRWLLNDFFVGFHRLPKPIQARTLQD